MGTLYELYNFTREEYTRVGKYSVNTKNWCESPLANFYFFMTKTHLFWFPDNNIRLISDNDDSYFDLRETFKDITDEAVSEYNDYAEDIDTQKILPVDSKYI